MTWMQKNIPSQCWLEPPSNVQSRHVPQEPHTNWDGIFCILPYLNISDFLWFWGFVLYYTIQLGTSLSSLWTKWLEPNDLNAEKIPAQQWLEPQATCILSMCHGSHTLTRMEFSFAFYHTYLNICDFLWFWKFVLYYTIPLGTYKEGQSL